MYFDFLMTEHKEENKLSWPENSKEEIKDLLSQISKRIDLIKPGEWCGDACLRALKKVRVAVWEAQILLGVEEIQNRRNKH